MVSKYKNNRMKNNIGRDNQKKKFNLLGAHHHFHQILAWYQLISPEGKQTQKNNILQVIVLQAHPSIGSNTTYHKATTKIL